MLKTLAFIALAGAAGTLARFGVSAAFSRWGGSGFPWATFTVNALGCFVFGLVAALAEEGGLVSAETKLVVLTGFLGAFTTFSTFAFDTTSLLREGKWLLGAVNLLSQNVVGVAMVLGGAAIGRYRLP